MKKEKFLLILTTILLLFSTTSFAFANSSENIKGQTNSSKIQLDYYFQNKKNISSEETMNSENSYDQNQNKTQNQTQTQTQKQAQKQTQNQNQTQSQTQNQAQTQAQNQNPNQTQQQSQNQSQSQSQNQNQTQNQSQNQTQNQNKTENQNSNSNTSPNAQLNLNAKSCILIETSTNRVAYEKNSEEKIYPASTTKLLTAIITLDHCNLQDTVIITKDMISNIPSGYTSAYLKPGEKLTIEQLLNSLLIPSANDAGFALAIHISGSIEEFAKLMNEKATEIGCTNSNFTNPSGIHDENHYSTAKDMGIIGLYALRYPQIADIVCKTSYVLQPENSYSRKFETTNTLIKSNEKNYYEYATGMKTGFTEPAGACLIASAKKDDMQFLAVILNAPSADNTANYRDLDAINLFEYGFANYQEIVKEEEKPQPIFNLSNGNFITEQNIYKILVIALILVILYLIIAITKSKSKK